MRFVRLLLALLAAQLAACAGDVPHPSPSLVDTTAQAPVHTAEGGVELRSVLAGDTRQIAAALAPFAAVVLPIDRATRQEWEACGIRLIAFPTREAGSLEQAIMASDRAASKATRWVANGPLWAEAAREPGSTQERVVALHDSRLLLKPGYIRLLARAWIEPTVRDDAGTPRTGAAARVELLPQLISLGSDDPWARSLRLPAARGLESQGQLVTRLRAELLLQPEQAVAIVFEEPGVDWARLLSQPPPPPPQPAQPDKPQGPGEVARLGQVKRDTPASPARNDSQTPPEPVAGPAAGPEVFRTPTLGELLLGSTRSTDGSAGGTRLVLLLIPRMRDELWLLGREMPPPSGSR
jgi:hypothetical protein